MHHFNWRYALLETLKRKKDVYPSTIDSLAPASLALAGLLPKAKVYLSLSQGSMLLLICVTSDFKLLE